MSANKYMLTIELNAAQYKRLQEISEMTGKPSTEVVAECFKLYDSAIDYLADGGQVIVRDKDGMDKAVARGWYD